jgi:ribosomal protein L3 glutamine methyltransferase
MVLYTNQTLKQILSSASKVLEQGDLFFGHGTDNAWDEACWLLESLLRRSGLSHIAEDMQLDEMILKEFQELIDRRLHEKKPLAYLLNEAWFAGMPFYVDERVIVPRSPFAELIQQRFEPLLGNEPKRILDLCCGSGCIGLATATVFPEAEIELSDLSSEALEVAAINIDKHVLSSRCRAIQSDLFDELSGQYDLILSNPPYVSRAEYQDLPIEYKKEPAIALLSEKEGLEIPVKILQRAADHLNDGGLLILETGNSWQALSDLYPDAPFLWLDFEQGGEGLCALTKKQLKEYNF